MANRYTCVNPGACDCGRVDGEHCLHWPVSDWPRDVHGPLYDWAHADRDPMAEWHMTRTEALVMFRRIVAGGGGV